MYRSISDTGYGAETFYSDSKIEFYADAFGVNPLNPKFRNNVVHELGHAFNAAIETASNGSISPYDNLAAAMLPDGALGLFLPREGMRSYPWQQAKISSTTENEVFADYFLNWTYGSFLNNAAGNAQSRWMSSQMGQWLTP